MVIYRGTYSPKFNPNKPEKKTGIKHKWIDYDGGYYDSTKICKKCGKKNWGWNLWKEDFLSTCKGKKDKEPPTSWASCTTAGLY